MSKLPPPPPPGPPSSPTPTRDTASVQSLCPNALLSCSQVSPQRFKHAETCTKQQLFASCHFVSKHAMNDWRFKSYMHLEMESCSDSLHQAGSNMVSMS